MTRRIGLTAGGESPWEGPLILEFTRHSVHSETVQYRAAFGDRAFDIYIPLFMLSSPEVGEAPRTLKVALDSSARAMRTLGFGGEWRPLAAETGVCEFAFAEEMVNSKKYQARGEKQVFSLYIPNQVFGDRPRSGPSVPTRLREVSGPPALARHGSATARNTGGAEMPQSHLRLIKRWAEFQPKESIASVPSKRRGLYVLYRKHREKGRDRYDVVYIGLATSGIRGRLESHRRSKGELWTHFSALEVWDNIRDDEIVELEGLFRHFYRRDTEANRLNVQRTFKKLKKVQQNDFATWK